MSTELATPRAASGMKSTGFEARPHWTPEQSLATARVGSVPYLNAVPLTAGLEESCLFLPPSELSVRMRRGELDAALVSITEVSADDGWHALDGFGIVSRGPVFSVFLAHRQPLEAMEMVHVDPASCTSVQLLRVLLAERGLHPAFVPLRGYGEAAGVDNVLLIGNPAIEFRRRNATDHRIWDLGQAWQEVGGLPFVYAVWALHSETSGPAGRDRINPDLADRLIGAGEAGCADLARIIAARQEFDLAFRTAYLGGHIQYRIDDEAKAGVELFTRLRQRHVSARTRSPDWIRPGGKKG